MNSVHIHPRINISTSDVSDGSLTLFTDTPTQPSTIPDHILSKLKIHRTDIIEMNQVHGSQVTVVDSAAKKKWAGKKIPATDALLTNLTHTPLLIKTADCIPTIIYDPEHHAVAACHIGWRGAMQKIHLVALLKMVAHYHTQPNAIKAWLGPAIQSCCYTVPKPPNQRHLPEWQPYITEKKDIWHIDYVGFVRDSLIDAGVPSQNINNHGDCTYHQKQWYSYARAQQTGEIDGRFATFVTLQ